MAPRSFILMAAVLLGFGAAANVITQKSVVNGVTIAVTAGNLGPEASVWDFAVVMRASDNRVLSDDLVKNAVLVDARGKQHKVLVWEGAAAEPQHRAGVLKFIAVSPRPDSVELRIVRAGEKKPRLFSWLLGNGMMASRQAPVTVASAASASP
jgi:hypothetical protein